VNAMKYRTCDHGFMRGRELRSGCAAGPRVTHASLGKSRCAAMLFAMAGA
jgi:hypothetical protein